MENPESQIYENIAEKKPFYIAREFRIKFQEQLKEEVVVPVRHADGKVVNYDDYRTREDAVEFMEKMKLFWGRAALSYKEFLQKPIAKTGAQYHGTKKFPLPEIDQVIEELKGVGHHGTFDPLYNVRDNTLLAFELYACIEVVKPDRIISLVNGAARLDSVAYALGADSMNYLSIHRSIDQDHRKTFSAGPIYEGKPIAPDSTVLLLEDTSEFGDERTFEVARTWLKDQGVTNVPVFFEYVTRLDQFAMGNEKNELDYIKIQEQLNRENCWNAYANTAPPRHSKFWTNTKSKLTEAIESNPQLISSFFELIRNYQ